ncbi:acyltransferase [Pseudomonas sp. NBRC 111123]|uniref:acyltransferase family protein n=1 Tax=Pseudomonas sp. NBRC 111123 TaxID=1661038 RepID=UPI0007611986|nr:acyltransferase [Pseudomonas sp. NBRC 111123]
MKQERSHAFFAPLESARGLAAILVAAFHIGQALFLTEYGVRDQLISSNEQSGGWQSWLSYFYGVFAAGGPLSPPVLFFFVLSGFVLSYSLDRSGISGKHAIEFCIRRVFRIYPAAIATVILFWLLNSVFGMRLSLDFGLTEVIQNSLLLDVSINGVMWTLQTELIGGLLVLLAMAVVSLVGRRSMLLMCSAFAMLSLFSFWYEYDPFGTSWSRTAYLHTFLFGSLAFLYGRDILRAVKCHGAMLIIAALIFFFAIQFIVGTQNPIPYRSSLISFAIIVQAAAAAMIVVILAYADVSATRFLSSRVLTFFGRISFSLYLLHPMTLMLVWSSPDSTDYAPMLIGKLIAFGLPNAVVAMILAVLSVLYITPLAYLFWRYIEMPVSEFCKRCLDGKGLKDESLRKKMHHAVPAQIFASAVVIFITFSATAVYAFASGSKPASSCADDFSLATTISGEAGIAVGSTERATSQVGELGHVPFSKPYHSVWCKWTAPASGLYAFETTGSDFDTVLAVYASTSMNSMPVIFANDNRSETDFTSRGEFKAEQGTTYSIAVDGSQGSQGAYVLKWSKVDK